MNTVITRIIAALFPALFLTTFGVKFVPYLVPLSTGFFIGALLFYLQSRLLVNSLLTRTAQCVKNTRMARDIRQTIRPAWKRRGIELLIAMLFCVFLHVAPIEGTLLRVLHWFSVVFIAQHLIFQACSYTSWIRALNTLTDWILK